MSLPLKFPLYLLALALAPLLSAAPLRQETEQFFPLSPNGEVTVENLDGSIHVYGWDEPRVRLATLRNAYTAPRLQQVRVETTSQPVALLVRTQIPPEHGLFADRSGTVDFTVNVPASARLKLKVHSGEISVDGLRGAHAQIELTNGRIFATNCYAEIKARAEYGAIDIGYQWWESLPAALEMMIAHGRIAVGLPAVAQFRVDAATANGNIGNGFGFRKKSESGPGEALVGATASDAPVTLHLRSGGGNISIDSFR